jgi:hypothetical protein
MRDVGLRVALRHVQPIRECPDGFRGFTLDDVLGGGAEAEGLVVDLKEHFRVMGGWVKLPHYEIAFRNANVLASHKGDSYNPSHCCSTPATPLSPPPPPLVD